MMKEIIKAVASAAGLGFLSWGISQLFGIWGITTIFGVPISWVTGKMMKAPGRDGYILRDVFERDPAGYFRNLHN